MHTGSHTVLQRLGFVSRPVSSTYSTISLINSKLFSLYSHFPAQRFAERGYIVIAQDVRGRFGSSGACDLAPHRNLIFIDDSWVAGTVS